MIRRAKCGRKSQMLAWSHSSRFLQAARGVAPRARLRAASSSCGRGAATGGSPPSGWRGGPSTSSETSITGDPRKASVPPEIRASAL